MMSNNSYICEPTNLYDEKFNTETTLILSSQNLITVPEIQNHFLSFIYLQNNELKTLPDSFFLSLPNLKWLDLRDNVLTDIPKSIKDHRALEHILLQNNKITTLPNELGTVTSLKVLQLSGNPLMYPPREVIRAGITKILSFLREKFIDQMLEESIADDKTNTSDYFDKLILEAQSYNSVIDGPRMLPRKTLSVQFSEREVIDDESNEYYTKVNGKCPKLSKSRIKILPPHCQSAKYVRPLLADPKNVQEGKMKQSCLEDIALKKQKDIISKRNKILQGKRNIEVLKNWRRDYKNRQLTLSYDNNIYKLTPKCYPYDTCPEYMTLLTREDIEKDLPDKFKRRLYRRSKPTIPRKSNNDVHLAMKIKQLFENLEAIDLNRETMSPRTEQKLLLGEIHKISEIKQKLMELSTTNVKSVAVD